MPILAMQIVSDEWFYKTYYAKGIPSVQNSKYIGISGIITD
jgi:hypothetical protein